MREVCQSPAASPRQRNDMLTLPPFVDRLLRKPPHRATAPSMPEWAARQRADLVAAGITPEKLARFDRLFNPAPLSMTDSEQQALVAALDRLDPKIRKALQAYCCDQRTVEAIAASMGISAQTCKQLIASGKRELQPYISRSRATTTAA
jgi:RNA polymerase sigma factor (sigma-70 family)